MKPIIILHGGAGSWVRINRHAERSILSKMLECAKLGFTKLINSNPLDAVELAVECMELSGLFNAGLGAYPNLKGELELDAGIMDGSRLKAGGVASVKNVPTPVKLARIVLEDTPHVIIVGDAAEKLAETRGLRSELKPKADRLALLREATRNKNIPCGGTVGAVAISESGDLASATSTGGLLAKMPGRVGDTPIPGAGFYADNSLGASSATGVGEKILVYQLSLRVVENLRSLKAQESAIETLNSMSRRLGENTAGVIVVDSRGRIGAYMNTNAMPIAVVTYDKELSIMLRRSRIKEDLRKLRALNV
jgi:beta-aspartyl-peptidase (threonine type)